MLKEGRCLHLLYVVFGVALACRDILAEIDLSQFDCPRETEFDRRLNRETDEFVLALGRRLGESW